MNDDVQLISDGDGLAVIGDPGAVERFLVSEGLASKDLGLARLSRTLNTGSTAAKAASDLQAASGRWVKLTQESAKKYHSGHLMKGSTSGVARAVEVNKNGQIKGILEIAKTPGAFLTSPARLAGVAGIMAQLAMQQTMEEITDYLAVIDEKVDDVIRGQKDAVLADMIGSGLVIDEALTVREHTGSVSATTWSTVQAEKKAIATTQAFALRRLDAIAEKLESRSKIGELAKTATEAVPQVQEWLAVLARCFQLQDALGVLELDRVLDADPDELDRHRVGLRKARENRLDLISGCTGRLLARMDAAASKANMKVLLNPMTSPVVVRSSESVASKVGEFHGRLGIESGRQSLEARRWVDAAGEVRDKVLETGAGGVDVARRGGSEAFNRARSMTGKVSSGIAERALRRREDDGPSEVES